MAQPGEEALSGPETAVQIRVAIQEAEDVEELEDEEEEEGAEARGSGDPSRYNPPNHHTRRFTCYFCFTLEETEALCG